MWKEFELISQYKNKLIKNGCFFFLFFFFGIYLNKKKNTWCLNVCINYNSFCNKSYWANHLIYSAFGSNISTFVVGNWKMVFRADDIPFRLFIILQIDHTNIFIVVIEFQAPESTQPRHNPIVCSHTHTKFVFKFRNLHSLSMESMHFHIPIPFCLNFLRYTFILTQKKKINIVP